MVAMMKRINLPVADMIIDPRAGAVNVRDAGHRVVHSFNQALEECGWTASRFRTLSVDKGDKSWSIDDGHRQINDLLAKTNRMTGQPMMMVSEECENTIWAAENYRTVEGSNDEAKVEPEKPEEKAKDPIDDWRYLLMANPHYDQSQAERERDNRVDYGIHADRESSDYDESTVFAR
jgi:hypothetical protein